MRLDILSKAISKLNAFCNDNNIPRENIEVIIDTKYSAYDKSESIEAHIINIVHPIMIAGHIVSTKITGTIDIDKKNNKDCETLKNLGFE